MLFIGGVIAAFGVRSGKWTKSKFVRKSTVSFFIIHPNNELQSLTYTGEQRARFNAWREALERLLYEAPEPQRSHLAAKLHKTLNELKTDLNILKLYEQKAGALEFVNGEIAKMKTQLFNVPVEDNPELFAELAHRER